VYFAVSKKLNIYPAFCPTNYCANCDSDYIYQFVSLRSILASVDYFAEVFFDGFQQLLGHGFPFKMVLPYFRCDCPENRFHMGRMRHLW
jgi:hypothetical protein